MKKILFTSFVLLVSILSFGQTTATDFTATDCDGNSHTLFTELDAGKVVVISFVMPCGGCISPSLSAYNAVQSYATSNPGRVVFYLSDDVGTLSCSSLSSWASTNGLSGANAIISNSALKQSDYGSGGMPKIVVLGGANHKIYFKQNSGLNTTNFNAAIAQALTASLTGISENTNVTTDFQMSLFPNPVTSGKTKLSYTLTKNSSVNMDVYNTLGAIVKKINIEEQTAGKHESEVNFESLSNGIYFVKLRAGESSQIVKFTIAH